MVSQSSLAVSAALPSVAASPSGESPVVSTPSGVASIPTSMQSASQASPPVATGSVFQKVSQFARDCLAFLLKMVISTIEYILPCIEGRDKNAKVEEPKGWQLPALTPAETEAIAKPPLSESDPFSKLPSPSRDEQQRIGSIITTLAEAERVPPKIVLGFSISCTPIFLAQHKSKLDAWVEGIKDVHPLKFLEFVLKHKQLTEDLKFLQGKHSDWTWASFIKDVKALLDAESSKESFLVCIPGFAHSVGANLEQMQAHVKEKKWEEMIAYLTSGHPALPNSIASETTAQSLPVSAMPPAQTASPASCTFLTQEQARGFNEALTEIEGAWSWWWSGTSLMQKLEALNPVHPLHLLGGLFMASTLGTIKKIRLDEARWNDSKSVLLKHFVKGASLPSTLSVDQFCTSVGIDQGKVSSLIENKKWPELLDVLIKEKA